MKNLLFLLALVSIAVSQEVSVFGAGDLGSKEPYGLTNTEKYILENKNNLDDLDGKIKDISSGIDSIGQRIDGLESIYETDGKKLKGATLQLSELTKQSTLNKEEIEKLKTISSQILQFQEENNKNNNKNLENLKNAITKLEKAINNINAAYISEKEFKQNMKQFVTKSEFDKLKTNQNTKKQTQKQTEQKAKATKKTPSKNENLTSAEQLAKAKKLYNEDMFTPAIEIFESLIEKNYKPAESNFYLGEIWYYRKKYNDAIKHFKESALLYDKAEYMPQLLLHSAISFEKINDLTNAASFYTTLLNVYPDSQEAQEASDRLNQLN